MAGWIKNPNLAHWQMYHQCATERGKLIRDVLATAINLDGAHILDFGCGSGGIALTLAKAGCRVDAADIDTNQIEFLQSQARKENCAVHTINIGEHPNKYWQHGRYDAIVLADTLEHIEKPKDLLQQLANTLKPTGVLYLSTPNKYAILNILNDPHYNLPLLSLCKRQTVKKIIADLLRWHSADKKDFPELFSLRELSTLLNNSGLQFKFIQHIVFSRALKHPEQLWNKSWHKRVIRKLDHPAIQYRLIKLLKKNDFFLNHWLVPSWYILAKPSNSTGVLTT